MPTFETALVMGIGCLTAVVASAQTEPQRFERPATAVRISGEADSSPQLGPSELQPDHRPTAPAPVANSATDAQPAAYVPLPSRPGASPANQRATSVASTPARLRPGEKPLKSLALGPRSTEASEGRDGPQRSAPSLTSLLGGLAIVLGLFFLLAWVMKRGLPKGTAVLPAEVVEVLGRSPLAPRQQMHLLRIGNKLLLVCISAAGAETLTEITDPVEVDRLAGLCQQTRAFSATNSFRQAFQQFAARRKPDVADESDALHAERPHA